MFRLRDLHNRRNALRPSRRNLQELDLPHIPLPHNITLILIPHEIKVLEVRARALPQSKVLRKDIATQAGLVAGDSAAEVGNAVGRVKGIAHRFHEHQDDGLLAVDRAVVEAGFVEGAEVHGYVVGKGGDEQVSVGIIKRIDEASDCVNGRFAVGEAVFVEHFAGFEDGVGSSSK